MVFKLTAQDDEARTGILTTAHGDVQTPFFMPVASKATVKALQGVDLQALGYESIISNSFLLSLSPGTDIVAKHGGVHEFMHFHNTIFTDSGGFQVLSKDFLQKKDDTGAIFKDGHGKKHHYTPEVAMENQLRLNSDVAMTFDDVAHFGLSGKEYVDAIRRTHDWARRCLAYHKKRRVELGSKQLLFGIAQGGTSKDYRRFSTYKISEMDFDGFALGGLVIGESRDELFANVEESVKHLPENKPRYLMGLGSPPDIVRAVGYGVDCFDSIYPTANARHGSMLTPTGRFMIKKRIYKDDTRPIFEGCTCSTCERYSRSYLHHLLRTHELLGYQLATVHNLHFMSQLMKDIREAIKEKRYDDFKKDFLEKYFSGKEAKEFSSNIAKRYKEEEERKKASIFVDYKP
jgi:queuine tRNA-ribosyltransferase